LSLKNANLDSLAPADCDVEGVVEMTLDATGNYAETLTENRLFAWHASLFPTGRSGMSKIRVGSWCDDRKERRLHAPWRHHPMDALPPRLMLKLILAIYRLS